VTSIQMPQLGETIVEGTILKWLKQEGETVERDEPLFEISTDKVDTEVPSPVAGTVTKILVAEGQTVAVGTELAEVDSGDEATAAEAPIPDQEQAESPEPPASTPEPASQPAEPAPQPAAQGQPAQPAPQAQPAAATAPDHPSAASLPDRGPRSQILSPLVRRLADEHGLDLATIAGSGTGGRITKKDVEAAIAAGGAAAGAAPGMAAAASAAPALQPMPSITPGAGEELVPMSHIRKAIADHMVASLATSARAWTMVEVNVDRLVKLREHVKDDFLERHGVKLTYLPLVADLVLRRYVNMGIAVSYDEGLIVPVVKGMESMNVHGIARAIADLAARARSHQLQPDEVAGATFTITNPGPYGSLLSVPIINQPNAGILSLDTIQKRPVVVDDAIAIRSMVYLSMSWDHRVIDGELATRFLGRVKQNLESWDFAEDLGI
jgi:pyruvate dehydrogenase E2 component (dihydrolipoamide acetyltransferase)